MSLAYLYSATEDAPSTGDMHNHITHLHVYVSYKGLKPYPSAAGLLLFKGHAWDIYLALLHSGDSPTGNISHKVLPPLCRLAIWLRENVALHLVHNMFSLPCCLQAAITIVKCPVSPSHCHWISICHGYRPEGSCPCKLPLTQNRVIPGNTDPCLCTVLQPWPFIFLWWSPTS